MLSRVADNFFWMSRYLERAEHTARLLAVQLELMPDQRRDGADRWRALLASVRCDGPDLGDDPAQAATRWLGFDTENPNSVTSCVASARQNALQVRQHISAEMFEHLNTLYWRARQTRGDDGWANAPLDFLRATQDAAHLFCGLTHSTMDHDQEFFFLETGRFLERASASARLLDVGFSAVKGAAEEGFEADEYLRWVGLLRSCTALEPYLRSHHHDVQPHYVAEFLLLDQTFPRSLRFSVDRVAEAVRRIAAATGSRRAEALDRLAGRLQASLHFTDIAEILGRGIHDFLAEVERRCDELNAAIYQTYISYPVEELD